MEKSKKEELLDIIALKAGCSYLSDVNLPIYKKKVLEVLEGIREENYSLREWQEVVAYIAGEDTQIKNCSQAKECLKQSLQKQHS